MKEKNKEMDIKNKILITKYNELKQIYDIDSNEVKDIRNELIFLNKALVHYVANWYVSRCVSLDIDDLISEGVLGLMRAIDKYDMSNDNDASFSTYATYWIRCRITRAIECKDRLIKLPSFQYYRVLKYFKLVDEGCSLEECASALEIPIGELSLLLNTYALQSSIDTNYFSQGKLTISEVIADETILDFNVKVMSIEMKEIIQNVINNMNDRDATIIKMRFGFDSFYPSTLEEIGKEYNVSKERIRQLEYKILRKLRVAISTEIKNAYELDSYEFDV